MVTSLSVCMRIALWSCWLSAFLPWGFASARTQSISTAVEFCAQHSAGIRLNKEGDVVCFDGPIWGRDLEPFNRLSENGILVIRSQGGDIVSAMKIADILMDKNATVVVDGYCLSACANAILVASKETYVLSGAIVAWHRTITKVRCEVPPRTLLAPLSNPEHHRFLQYQEAYCANVAFMDEFYKKRRILDDFTHTPQTSHTVRVFDFTVRTSPNPYNVFWMWHPNNHGNYFGTKITYEKYPESQDETNEIVRRFGLPIQFVYDIAM